MVPENQRPAGPPTVQLTVGLHGERGNMPILDHLYNPDRLQVFSRQVNRRKP